MNKIKIWAIKDAGISTVSGSTICFVAASATNRSLYSAKTKLGEVLRAQVSIDLTIRQKKNLKIHLAMMFSAFLGGIILWLTIRACKKDLLW